MILIFDLDQKISDIMQLCFDHLILLPSYDDHKVGNDQMAMCDETSLVKPDDFIAADYYDKLFPVQHYRLVDFNAKQHRCVF